MREVKHLEIKQLNEVQRAAAAGPPRAIPAARLRAEIARLAELGRVALGAAACAVAWNAPGSAEESAAASTDAEALSAARIALAALAQRDACGEIRAERIAPNVIGIALSTAGIALGAVPGQGAIAVRAAIAHLKDAGRTTQKTQAILELIARGAAAAIAEAQSVGSRAFWRDRGARLIARDAASAASAAASKAERDTVECAVREISGLTGLGRMAAMGEAVARALGCRRWIVAAPRDGALRIVAAARAIAPARELPESGAIVECSRTGRILSSAHSVATPRALPEDKIFGSAWIVFPAGPAVIGLAEGEIDAPGFSARAEAFGAWLAPLLRAWIAEDALEAHRSLVSRLALRMYAAIDDERARIARDLHDDQAQLLAAAQIALEGGTEEARGLFRQIAQELRARIRDLKPPALGRVTLADALEAEAGRMRQQGIEVHLLRTKDAAHISAPVQQLCWQVAREALANVARHAGASTVEVSVERDERCSRVIVRDNGRGMPTPPGAHAAAGISGIRERLELMGGKLEIESGPSGTILRAEIPEPA